MNQNKTNLKIQWLYFDEVASSLTVLLKITKMEWFKNIKNKNKTFKTLRKK